MDDLTKFRYNKAEREQTGRSHLSYSYKLQRCKLILSSYRAYGNQRALCSTSRTIAREGGRLKVEHGNKEQLLQAANYHPFGALYFPQLLFWNVIPLCGGVTAS